MEQTVYMKIKIPDSTEVAFKWWLTEFSIQLMIFWYSPIFTDIPHTISWKGKI